jgi:hypothetical protein
LANFSNSASSVLQLCRLNKFALGGEKANCLEQDLRPAELEELAEAAVNRSQDPAVSQGGHSILAWCR